MRLKVLRRYLRAWQAQIPYCHAPAIYCSASPLLLQLAVAATTVAPTPRAQDYTVRTEAESPLDHGAAMR
eukprot:3777319-Pleurochrysis_carterae.AAC.1